MHILKDRQTSARERPDLARFRQKLDRSRPTMDETRPKLARTHQTSDPNFANFDHTIPAETTNFGAMSTKFGRDSEQMGKLGRRNDNNLGTFVEQRSGPHGRDGPWNAETPIVCACSAEFGGFYIFSTGWGQEGWSSPVLTTPLLTTLLTTPSGGERRRPGIAGTSILIFSTSSCASLTKLRPNPTKAAPSVAQSQGGRRPSLLAPPAD